MTTSNNHHNTFYFFIGTEAEFIKMFPVMKEFEKRKIPYILIFSGQNDIQKSLLFTFISHQKPDLVFSEDNIPQHSIGLLLWWLRVTFKGFFQLKRVKGGKDSTIIVHGDTVSTVMGALLGKLCGMRVAHLESGLRSFNLMQPFPEEIDRLIVSKLADIQFCPNEWAMQNVASSKAVRVNTKENTLIESLSYAIDQKHSSKKSHRTQQYFIFVLHRQENLLDRKLIEYLIKDFLLKENKMRCVFMLHGFTKQMLLKYQLLDLIKANKYITTVDRMSYPEFMRVIQKAEFVITDGGSNQEECYYLGVPTLLLRNVTERIEGLNKNVVISKNDLSTIKRFVGDYKSYRFPKVTLTIKPSQVITDYLTQT